MGQSAVAFAKLRLLILSAVHGCHAFHLRDRHTGQNGCRSVNFGTLAKIITAGATANAIPRPWPVVCFGSIAVIWSVAATTWQEGSPLGRMLPVDPTERSRSRERS